MNKISEIKIMEKNKPEQAPPIDTWTRHDLINIPIDFD